MKSAREALALVGCLAIITGGVGLLGVKCVYDVEIPIQKKLRGV